MLDNLSIHYIACYASIENFLESSGTITINWETSNEFSLFPFLDLHRPASINE
jgi:hypothetical protein